MGLANFTKTYIASTIIMALKKVLVAGSVANQEYTGQITDINGEVDIIQLPNVTISGYTKGSGLNAQTINDAVTKLKADQAYYFDIKLYDVEGNDLKQRIMTALSDNAAYGFRDTSDQYLLGLYAQAGLTSYYTGTTPWDVTSLNVEDVLLDVKEQMARVPQAGRYAIIPEWFHGKLLTAGILAKTSNDNLFDNGLITRAYGFDWYLSENVSASNTSTWDQTRILFGQKGVSMAYCDAIVKTETARVEADFADLIKGIHVFGGKVTRPDTLCCAYCDKTAES